jgi:hypothetical protein
MTIQECNTQMTQELKSFIKSEGYVSSGKLINSIKFKSTFINNELKIKFDAMEYINYLDDGNLVSKFFDQQNVIDLIQSVYTDNLEL